MAYLRDEKESFEIDYPLEALWAAIPKVAKTLEWSIEEKDDAKHFVKFKTKSGFLSYSTTVTVEAKSVDEKTTRMSINAETPVTTITSMVDIGRTRYRVDTFMEALAKQMEKKK
jgi:carbon monoxide dehydrogenase subunit G